MVSFDSVSKQYVRGSAALDHISFTISDGEFVFLVGPSGAGKTTLLKLINREVLPSSGTVRVDEWNVPTLTESQIPYLRRRVGYIFQDFKLLPDRTVEENVSLALEILGISPSSATSRIHDILETVHLAHKKHYFPKQLSLGEQQRVSIARAIIGETKILLADEPTGNLDPKTSWEILKILTTIHKRGTTIIMATHNVDIVNSMKKRVIKIVDGKVSKDEKKSVY